MTDIQIEIIEIDKYKVYIPTELKDSKVAEKFATAYLENMAKVKIEEEKTKQLELQLEAEEKKRQFRKNFYWAGIIIILGFIIGCILNFRN